MSKKNKITVTNIPISILTADNGDYICITDMVKGNDNRRAADVIKNWIRSKSTIDFLGAWETINNPDFKVVEFDHFRKDAGVPSFVMSVSDWVAKTGAIGIISKSGKDGGTYAHRDIAFEFGTAISPIFKLYLIKEYQLLKEQEAKIQNLEWNVSRYLSKINYRVHTDAIKETIIPKYHNISKFDETSIYVNNAEMLNMAVFGCTSKQWKQENPKLVLDGLSIRECATIHQLTVLANLESYHATLIKDGLPPNKRLEKLKEVAISQLKSLSAYTYSYPIESPHVLKNQNSSMGFDTALKGLLNTPPPQKDK